MATEDEPEIVLSPEEMEAWYDANVAPALMSLGEECVKRGIPLLAVVGFDGPERGSSGRTMCFPPKRAHFFCVMDAAARCWGDGGRFNLDKFVIAAVRDARGKPHSSIVLRMMGVPEEPEP